MSLEIPSTTIRKSREPPLVTITHYILLTLGTIEDSARLWGGTHPHLLHLVYPCRVEVLRELIQHPEPSQPLDLSLPGGLEPPPRRCPSPTRAARNHRSRTPPPRRPTSPPRMERRRPSRTPPRVRPDSRERQPRQSSRDRPRHREISPPIFACRDYRYQDPSLDEQRRTVAVRLGFIPRSHLRARSPNFRAAELENEARDREREMELLRRELQRAPANDPDRRSLELQIQHLANVVRRSRAAARRLRSPSPANKRERR